MRIVDNICELVTPGNPGDVHVYTDGACKNNPGPGGWGAVFVSGENKFTASGYVPDTTNNRMEILATINAILNVQSLPISTVHIYTDSVYVKGGITVWIKKWLTNQWKTSSKQDVKNRDLWVELYLLVSTSKISIEWHWVRGHGDSVFNNEADALARREIVNNN